MTTAKHTMTETEVTRRNRELIDDLCAGCCRPAHYCTLKEILARSPRDTRTMLLIKCIEKFKYERSAKAGHDIGWDEAFHAWIQEGLVERFSRIYHPGIRLAALYRTVMERPAT